MSQITSWIFISLEFNYYINIAEGTPGLSILFILIQNVIIHIMYMISDGFQMIAMFIT